MSAPDPLQALRLAVEGRRFLGLTELEALVPGPAGLEVLEDAWDLLFDLQVIVVDEVNVRPVGHYPAWDARYWVAAQAPRVNDDGWTREDVDSLHARALGRETLAQEDEDEDPEDAEEASQGQASDAVMRRLLEDAPELEPEEFEALALRACEGDGEARGQVVHGMLRRVTQLARRYARNGARRDDLIQSGNLGLVEAFETFEPGGSRSFRSFAERCIRRALGRHLAEERRTIRVPRKVDKEIRRLLRADEVLRKAHGRRPTEAELATELGVDTDEVAYLVSFLRAPVSLQGAADEGGVRLEETLADPLAPLPAEAGEAMGRSQQVRTLLADLPLSQARVMVLRFGLEDGLERTREEVAAATGFTLAEVRGLEEEALATLRSGGGSTP